MDGEFEVILNFFNGISLVDKRFFIVCGIMNVILLWKVVVIFSIR